MKPVGVEGGDISISTGLPVDTQTSDVQLVASWCSPMAHQVAIALRQKGVKFKVIEEGCLNKNLKTLHASPLYKRIPILIHKRKLISESLIILEYIEDAWSTDSTQLLPTDPFERSAVRYWSNHVQNKVILTLLRYAEGGADHLNTNLEDTFICLNRVLSVTAPDSSFFMGDELSMVDIVFASVLPWVQALESLNLFKLPSSLQCPRLHRWIEALEQHCSVKPTLQICTPEKLQAFITQTLRKSRPAEVSVKLQ
ncbi:hypothetical protein R1flu_009464 [Riccia fluitans]|uniref:glutathione transferase n=1 Tax=Riccia fluitans TaxID=41844 RepID=A0ABD1Z261_9MARC